MVISSPDCVHWSACSVVGGGCCGLADVAAKVGRPSVGYCTLVCKSRAPGDGGEKGPNRETVERFRREQPRHLTIEDRGPALWAEFHGRATRYRGEEEAERGWLKYFGANVPCGECRRHWNGILAQMPPDLSSAESYFAWTVAVHNLVNVRLGKPQVSLEEARQLQQAATVQTVVADQPRADGEDHPRDEGDAPKPKLAVDLAL